MTRATCSIMYPMTNIQFEVDVKKVKLPSFKLCDSKAYLVQHQPSLSWAKYSCWDKLNSTQRGTPESVHSVRTVCTAINHTCQRNLDILFLCHRIFAVIAGINLILTKHASMQSFLSLDRSGRISKLNKNESHPRGCLHISQRCVWLICNTFHFHCGKNGAKFLQCNVANRSDGLQNA